MPGVTVGVLVQANYGGLLTIDGVPLGSALDRYDFKREAEERRADGSVIIVIATDAPLSVRNLRRLAARAFAGIARTGSALSNESGDYATASATAPMVRRDTAITPERMPQIVDLPNDRMSGAFQAVAEATEEAVLNAMFSAKTVNGHRDTIEALPIDRVLPMLRRPSRQ